MKFTQVLCKQHIGRAISLLWQRQRQRRISVTKAEEILTSNGYEVRDPSEIVNQGNPIIALPTKQ